VTAAAQLAAPLTPIPAVDSRVLQLATDLLGKLDELEDLIVQISVAVASREPVRPCRDTSASKT